MTGFHAHRFAIVSLASRELFFWGIQLIGRWGSKYEEVLGYSSILHIFDVNSVTKFHKLTVSSLICNIFDVKDLSDYVIVEFLFIYMQHIYVCYTFYQHSFFFFNYYWAINVCILCSNCCSNYYYFFNKKRWPLWRLKLPQFSYFFNKRNDNSGGSNCHYMHKISRHFKLCLLRQLLWRSTINCHFTPSGRKNYGSFETASLVYSGG